MLFLLIGPTFQFIAKSGDKARTAKDGSLTDSCRILLTKICEKYDNLNEIDKLASVSMKVDSIKLVMQDNVDLALQNCVKLETIEKAAGTSLPLCYIAFAVLFLSSVSSGRGASATGRSVQEKC